MEIDIADGDAETLTPISAHRFLRRDIFVAGVEGELGYLKLSGYGFDPLDPIGPNNILSLTKIGDWYGMLTGRLGYAWDRALLYVKGGAAFVNTQSLVSDVMTGFSASTSNTRSLYEFIGDLDGVLVETTHVHPLSAVALANANIQQEIRPAGLGCSLLGVAAEHAEEGAFNVHDGTLRSSGGMS